MLKSPIPCEKPAMTKTEAKPVAEIVNELFSKSPDGLRELVRAVMQEMLEAEMTDALGAEKGERSAARLGYRSGYYSRRHCHVWMAPADQGLFRRCAGRGSGHVFGLSRGRLDRLALMLSADPLPRSRQRA
jgi:Transposase, Mutator family